jgi:hypothetical protein
MYVVASLESVYLIEVAQPFFFPFLPEQIVRDRESLGRQKGLFTYSPLVSCQNFHTQSVRGLKETEGLNLSNFSCQKNSSVHKMYADLGRDGRKFWLRKLQFQTTLSFSSALVNPSTVSFGADHRYASHTRRASQIYAWWLK